ncbi:MAG: hypothetical protein ACREUV_08845, partial [Burkholderiales bacterium]
HDNRAELHASDGLDAQWAEYWIYDLETGHGDYRQLPEREMIPERLAAELDALVNDFLDEYIWFSASAPEDTAIEKQRYERMGLTPHEANIKSGKILQMEKSGDRGDYFIAGMSHNDHAWIKKIISECWLTG